MCVCTMFYIDIFSRVGEGEGGNISKPETIGVIPHFSRTESIGKIYVLTSSERKICDIFSAFFSHDASQKDIKVVQS